MTLKLDSFQQEAVNHYLDGKNVLVSAPTGSGKTLIAETCIEHALANYDEPNIVYLSPIKALSNEKFGMFIKRFGVKNVGLLTGDFKINIQAKLRIMTTEIFHNEMLSSDATPHLVVFDEIHYINSADRGYVWENTLIGLSMSDTQLVMLSATINRIEKLADWLNSINKRQTSIVKNTVRYVPLYHYLYVDSTMLKYLKRKTDYKSKQRYEKYSKYPFIKFYSSGDEFSDNAYKTYLNLSSKQTNTISIVNDLHTKLTHYNMLPAIYFIFNKQLCDDMARSTDYQCYIQGSDTYFISQVQRHAEALVDCHQYRFLLTLIYKGVCVHHAGILPIFKEIIESMFAKRLLNIVFATETLAIGVNLPVRTCVFINCSKLNRMLRTDEYFQLAGRAGRRGIDDVGNVIHVNRHARLDDTNMPCALPSLVDMQNMVFFTMPELTSKYKLTLHSYLNMIKRGTCPHSTVNRSMLYIEQQRQASHVTKKKAKTKKMTLSDFILKNEADDILNYLPREVDNLNEYCISNGFIDKDNKLTTKGTHALLLLWVDPVKYMSIDFSKYTFEECILILALLINTHKEEFNNPCYVDDYNIPEIEDANIEYANIIYHVIFNQECTCDYPLPYHGEAYQVIQQVYQVCIAHSTILELSNNIAELDKMKNMRYIAGDYFTPYSIHI